jgi:hypothetical protein
MLVMALQMGGGIAWMITLAALVIVWKYLPRRYRPTLNAWTLRQGQLGRVAATSNTRSLASGSPMVIRTPS